MNTHPHENSPQTRPSISRQQSLRQYAFARLRKNKLALYSLYYLLCLIALAILTPWIAPYSYETQNLELGASAPSIAHWLGTDVLGRDMLTRILYGSRMSLSVAAVATTVALFIGVLWGTIAGYMGGKVDAFMMRAVDILYALPFMLFIILLMVVFGRSLLLLFIAIGCVEWLTMARIVRSQVLSLRQMDFIKAAVAGGLNDWQIIYRHIIPNVSGQVIVYVTLTIPGVMLLEAFLSFLGLGIQPPQSSWGLLIAAGAESMEEYPWVLVFPGLALSTTLFALNFLGDGLRDALDPRAIGD
jgi:oligopeptide transport system permease protein